MNANHVFPSMNISVTGNFSVNASFGLGVGPNGLAAEVNISGTYHNGDFALTGGIGASENMSSWGVSAMYKGYGVSYYRTTYGNATGPDGKPNNQLVGAWSLYFNYNSIRVENDLFGDKLDRWRTSAVEINVGNFVIGKSVYTNEPDGKNIDKSYTSRFWDRLGFNATKDAYADGRVFNSPLYIGVRRGGMVTRIGINHPIVQDIFQNGWHLFGSKGSPFFPTPYKGHDDYYFTAHRYSGYYNPYSLY